MFLVRRDFPPRHAERHRRVEDAGASCGREAVVLGEAVTAAIGEGSPCRRRRVGWFHEDAAGDEGPGRQRRGSPPGARRGPCAACAGMVRGRGWRGRRRPLGAENWEAGVSRSSVPRRYGRGMRHQFSHGALGTKTRSLIARILAARLPGRGWGGVRLAPSSPSSRAHASSIFSVGLVTVVAAAIDRIHDNPSGITSNASSWRRRGVRPAAAAPKWPKMTRPPRRGTTAPGPLRAWNITRSWWPGPGRGHVVLSSEPRGPGRTMPRLCRQASSHREMEEGPRRRGPPVDRPSSRMGSIWCRIAVEARTLTELRNR